MVKWAGGKAGLLSELLPLVPDTVERYIEPFAGGAALFFALAAQAPRRFKKALLADTNADLIALYRSLQSDPDALIESLAQYHHDEDLYYATRDRDPNEMSEVERAARLVFLNRTCFNGLWRVNSKGKFNVPFGRYANPKILDEPRLRNAAAALKRATLQHGDFERVSAKAKPGDFVYFDPPYLPVSRTANFTAYGSDGFGADEQERLLRELVRLRALKVRAVLSNADTAEARALYKGFAMKVVHMRRPINRDIKKRGHVGELLVMTWGKRGIEEAQ